MDSLIDDIVQYALFLKNRLHDSVSIHGTNGFLTPFLDRLAPLNIHDNAYCLFVKTNPAAWNHCIACQAKVAARCESGPFAGVCHAGVGEFVFPIRGKAGVIGFVSVSGYRLREPLARAKRNHMAAKFGFSPVMLGRVYARAMNPDAPALSRLRPVVMPLCHMLETLAAVYGRPPGNTAAENTLGLMISYIERHFAEPFTIPELAASCHCSVSTVSHTFKTHTGTGVSRYVNHLRVRHAISLLENTTLSIQQISDCAGFGSANYFSNLFRRLIGVSPSAYRAAGGKTASRPDRAGQKKLPPRNPEGDGASRHAV